MNVSSGEAFTLTLRAFYFPDWYGALDGSAAKVFAANEFGVVGVRVPAGHHTLTLTQTLSAPALVGVWLTALSGIAFGILGAFAFRARERERFLPLALFVCAVFVFALPLASSAFARPLEMTPTQVTLDEANPSLRVIGYGVELAPQNILTVHLIWQVLNPLTRQEPIELRLVNQAGSVVARQERLARYGGGGMTLWARDMLAKDRYEIGLPNDLDCAPHFLEIRRGGENEFARLGAVTISPCPLPARAEPEFQAVNARFGENMVLGGIAPVSERTFHPGEMARLILYWRAEADLRRDLEVTLQLIDRDGEKIAQVDSEPEFGFAPTSLWLRDRWIADTRELNISPDAAPGIVEIRAGVSHAPGKFLPAQLNGQPQEEDLIPIGTLHIAPRAPREPPTLNLNVLAGDAIRLRGVSGDLVNENKNEARVNGADVLRVNAARAQTLRLKFFWERVRAMPLDDYTVFVHVLNAAGELVAQIDRQPVRGKFPTSQWALNEIVTDEYEIDFGNFAAGQYQIFAGMYDRATGERLTLQDASGHALPDARVRAAEVMVGDK